MKNISQTIRSIYSCLILFGILAIFLELRMIRINMSQSKEIQFTQSRDDHELGHSVNLPNGMLATSVLEDPQEVYIISPIVQYRSKISTNPDGTINWLWKSAIPVKVVKDAYAEE